MKRFLAVALITLGFSISLEAQEPTKAPTKTSAQKTRPSTTRKRPRKRTRRTTPPVATVKPEEKLWSTFTSAAGRFSVLMPGKPTDKTETVQTEHGPYTSHVVALRDTKNTFLIGWVDYHPSFNFHRQVELEMNRDVFVSDLKAKLVYTRDMVIDGYQAIEFTAETADKVYTSRIYMVGRRPYQIAIGSPKGENDSVAVDRFLNSFKISLN